MIDQGSLLATLAQSSAAVVAIVGGFLVSRLVQLSSEREGLRRQLLRTQDELKHLEKAYDEAHGYRLTNSQHDFRGWILDDLIKADLATLDRDALLADRVPRGSSAEEIAPYFDSLIDEVAQVKAAVMKHIRRSDVNTLELDELRDRGLKVPEAQEDIYYGVAEAVIELLPEPPAYGGFSITPPRLALGT